MLTYDFLAGFLVLIIGSAIIIDRALANYDSRPFDRDDEHHPEVETRRDQRFRQADGQ